jgi:glycolate oxidase iron-sulfur subunit
MIGIEEKNTREEIVELLEKCTKCGLCKELCPVFKALREEQYSPRGHVIMLTNKVFDKILFDCTLCKACEEKCPFNLEICRAIKKARNLLNLKGKDLEETKKLSRRVLDKRNPYTG